MSHNTTPFSIVNDFWYYDSYGSSYQQEPIFNGLVDPNDVCSMEFRIQDDDVRTIKFPDQVQEQLDNENQNLQHNRQQQTYQDPNIQLGQLEHQQILELQQLELQHLGLQQLQLQQVDREREPLPLQIHQGHLDQQLLIDQHQYRQQFQDEQLQQLNQHQKTKKQRRTRRHHKRQARYQSSVHKLNVASFVPTKSKSYSQKDVGKKMTGRERQYELERREKELIEEQGRLKTSIARLERQTTTMKAILEDLVVTSPDYPNQMTHVIMTTDIFLEPQAGVSGGGAGATDSVTI